MEFLNRLFGGPAESKPPVGDPARIKDVEAVLERMRPYFESDGGDIRLVRVDEFGWVEVSMHGACNGCQASSMTLKGALEPELAKNFDWFEGLRAV
ncbi:MAG: Fe-S cluster biogenesis protein NfuA [Planctomycetota bacterium]|jgi:Fe-S cluster biogenesis protein NfuA